MDALDRRSFLRKTGVVAGSLAFAGPFQALMARGASAQTPLGTGAETLLDRGDLYLPPGFQYSILSRGGEPMTNGDPAPSRFDGMAAFAGPDGTTVLMRNHENVSHATMRVAAETPVVVPPSLRYDPHPNYIGGVTRLVVDGREKVEESAVLGGTTNNCAGGATPWGSWLTCEEESQNRAGALPHGYIFEVSSDPEQIGTPRPIRSAGRFVHEAVAWHDGILYETEDMNNSCFYRYIPSTEPSNVDDLANSTGMLQALRLKGTKETEGFDTRLHNSWPDGVGATHDVEWVTISNPNPANPNDTTQGVRFQAARGGAAIFHRLEGIWASAGKVYFDATAGGGTMVQPADGNGQLFEFDPAAGTITLIYQASRTNPALRRPDNLTQTRWGDLLVCEDNGVEDEPGNYVRGLTPDGRIFDFARAKTHLGEFCGACFSPDGETLFLNQQAGAPQGIPSVTYAIWGPWESRRWKDAPQRVPDHAERVPDYAPEPAGEDVSTEQ
jgi:secreted PhoX family phosphatase